jgi:7-carboxy-7-deazaguanine synthase
MDIAERDIFENLAKGDDDNNPDKKVAVIEIFGPTIQGEGRVAGVQTLFIRFGGCDFRCKKCDSLHAVLPKLIKEHATYMTQEEIYIALVDKAMKTNTQWITFSGGNPLIYELGELVYNLQRVGLKVTVETQGSYWRDWIMLCDSIVLSPKAPGMGASYDHEVFTQFLDKLTWRKDDVSVKIVCFSFADVEFALSIFGCGHSFFSRTGRKFISLGNEMPPWYSGGPEKRDFDPGMLVQNYQVLLEDILQDPRTKDIIVLPQIHVLLWGNRAGV